MLVDARSGLWRIAGLSIEASGMGGSVNDVARTEEDIREYNSFYISITYQNESYNLSSGELKNE